MLASARLYDLAIRLTMPELRFKQQLLASAAIGAGHRVLDVGCGTGTLLAMAAKRSPEAAFVGIDVEPRILARARRKTARWRGRVTIEEASATELPFETASFDRVVSTLVFHHLDDDQKLAAMREILRVLRPAGEFHLGDFGPPDTKAMRVASWLTAKIGHEYVDQNYAGVLIPMLRESGFGDVSETGRAGTIFGALRAIRAVKL